MRERTEHREQVWMALERLRNWDFSGGLPSVDAPMERSVAVGGYFANCCVSAHEHSTGNGVFLNRLVSEQVEVGQRGIFYNPSVAGAYRVGCFTASPSCPRARVGRKLATDC